MFRNRLYIIICVLLAGLVQSCSDDLTSLNTDGEADGIVFSLGVEEQADIIYSMGKTRTNGEPMLDSLTDVANTVGVHALEGASEHLYVHRMPLPLVGIHPHTAHAENISDDTNPTRAALTEIANDGINFHDSLTIWGYTSNNRTLLNGVLLKKINGWRSHVHWPYDHTLSGADAGKEDPAYMKFYAVSPAIESFEDYKQVTVPAYDTKPTFTYKTPDDIALQRDLLYGESTLNTSSDVWGNVPVQSGPEGSTSNDPREENLGQDNKQVKLKFRHILTSIRFAQGKMPVGLTIKNIQIYQVKNQGTYDAATGTWGSLSGTTDYDIPVSTTVADYNPGSNVYIDGGNVLFLMPQTVASGAQLKITVNDGSDRVLTASLEGDTWLPGYTVTYKVTVGEVASGYYLVIEPDASYSTSGTENYIPNQNETGNSTNPTYKEATGSREPDGSSSGSFIIHSFRNFKNYVNNASGLNNHHAEPWQVVGFSDPGATFEKGTYTYNNAHAIAWVISFTGWNSGSETQAEQTGGDYVTVNYTLSPQSTAYTGNHQTILLGNNPVTSMNLSTHLPDGRTTGVAMLGYSSGSIYNSANCYIINTQGSYTLPLVYGNSYEGGTKKTGSALNPGNIFKDHAGRTITEAHIIDQVNYTVSTDVEEAATTEDKAVEGCSSATKTLVTTDVLYNYAASDYKAEIIWTDVSGVFSITSSTSPGIVSTITKGGSSGSLGFDVSSSLKPGNCVIAFKAKKTIKETRKIYEGDTKKGERTLYSTASDFEILWTWHIWVTDEVYPNAGTVDANYPQYANSSKIVSLQNAGGTETAKILPVNLGWVPDEMEWNKYNPREIWVKIKQTNSDEVAYFSLRREAKQDLVTGTSTIYQWGRPTALPMLNTISGSARTIYDGAASPADITPNFTSTAITTPEVAVTSPTKMATGWNPTVAYWAPDSKTLYDPCPPGFQMPASSVFYGFSLTKDTTTDPSKLNMWPTEGNSRNGGYFYAKSGDALPGASSSERYGAKVYIPATGTWTDSYVQGNTTAGYYWTGTSGTSWQVLPDNISGWITFDATNLGNGYALPIRAKGQ